VPSSILRRPSAIQQLSDIDRVLVYHDATKHRPNRYARSTGYLDWANQPDAFRRYAGADLVELLVGPRPREPRYDQLFTTGAISAESMNRRTLSEFLECSLGLSAWKQYGESTWALRCNPSSGNLHPTEGYIVCGPSPGIGEQPAVYHYAPRIHALERRHEISGDVWSSMCASASSSGEAFLVGVSSILWREAWKYGERAFRYCNHDVGHAVAALRFAAAMLGWRMRLLDHLGDADVAALLGLDRAEDFENVEHEEPDLLALVWRNDAPPPRFDASHIPAAAAGPWFGMANLLSKERVPWDIIDMVAGSTIKPRSAAYDLTPAAIGHQPPVAQTADKFAGREIILRRRSATDFDGKTSIASQTFYEMLSRLMPYEHRIPWDVIGWPPCIHLAMFVHRVDGLSPGLYALVRDHAKVDLIRSQTRPDFAWSKPTGCPEHLPLYFLFEADCRNAAKQLSLQQEIAGDSAFSFGMLAELKDSLNEFGPWFYRRLFWEAGMIGQVLYLEAEAAALRVANSLRATGIGAYFDDPVHEVFGITGHALQSMYHFTLGGAVDDTRLTTRPPYGPDIVARR
jgi:SagB-type dehydrogenase family enzyme